MREAWNTGLPGNDEGLRNMLRLVADREKEIVITRDLNFDLKQSNKPAFTKCIINMTKEFSLH